MVLLFLVSANGWTYLVLKNSLSTFTTNNCQVRQSDQSILKNEPTVQFIILLTRTRTLRKFIPNRSARYTIEYLIEFGKTQSNKKLFRPQTIFFCGHILRQDCPCVIKVRGGPSNQAAKEPAVKPGRGVFPEILAKSFLIRDISLHTDVEIAEEIEVTMLFHRSLPSTRCLSDRIWYYNTASKIRVQATRCGVQE